MPQSDRAIEFRCEGLPDADFTVARFEGEEEISRPYWFRIELVSDDPEIALRDALDTEALLTVRHGDEIREVAGIVGEFEQCRELPDNRFLYRALLVPRLSLLGQSRQCQIYGTAEPVTIPDIIERELKEDSKKALEGIDRQPRRPIDYDMRLGREYPERDYIVQYNESDLDFISRLMEHRGIFYFFEVTDGRDTVVIGDESFAFGTAGGAPIPYRPPSGLAAPAAHAIHRFTCRSRMLPGKVTLRDYNYRLPHVSLLAEMGVDEAGHGIVANHGDHFRTPEEGKWLASLRAEQLRCEGDVYSGAGTCVAFSAGHLFELDDHYRSAFNRGYLIVRVRHRGGQSVPGIDLGGPADEGLGYRNEFEAIVDDLTYRPPLRTPKPVMSGILNAHIDAEGPGSRAEIDEDGRYKVVLPFDLSGAGQGEASRFMRKAEPYGGARGGMHFPLLKDTEVLLACVGGDPDRPIILGTVANPRSRTVSNNASHDRNRIQTTSGILMEFADGLSDLEEESGAEDEGAAFLTPQPQGQGIEGLPSPVGVTLPPPPESAEEETAPMDPAAPAPARPHANWWRLRLPHAGNGNGTKAQSYMRLGMAPVLSTDPPEQCLVDRMAKAKAFPGSWKKAGIDGFLFATDADGARYTAGSTWDGVGKDALAHVAGKHESHIDGSRVAVVGGGNVEADQSVENKTKVVDKLTVNGKQHVTIRGNEHHEVEGDSRFVVGGKSNVLFKSEKKTVSQAKDVGIKHGYAVSLFFGEKFSLFVGPSQSISLAQKIDLSLANALSLKLGVLNVSLTGSTDFKFALAGTIAIDVGMSVKITPAEAKIEVMGVQIKKIPLLVKSKETEVEQSVATVKVTGNETIA